MITPTPVAPSGRPRALDPAIRRPRRGFTLWRALPLAALIVATANATRADDRAFRVAFSPYFFGEVGHADAIAAVVAWQERILKPDGVPFNPHPLICRDTSELVDALRKGEVDAVALRFTEFQAIPPGLLDADQYYINVRRGAYYDRYVLVAGPSADSTHLDLLKGTRLVVWDHQRTCLVPAWLDVLLSQHGLGPADKFFADQTREAKPAKVVLPVFFGQADACVTTLSGFSDMCELNPQVGTKLRVIATSPPLVPSFLCFRSGYKAPDRVRIEAAIENLYKSASGRQVLTVFGCERITAVAGNYLQSAHDLWSRQESLAGRSPSAKATPADQADGGETR